MSKPDSASSNSMKDDGELECVNCHKRTIRVETETRNFNTGFCAYCGYGLEPVVSNDRELRQQLLDIFYKHVVNVEPYLDKAWSVHGIDAIVAFIQSQTANAALEARQTELEDLRALAAQHREIAWALEFDSRITKIKAALHSEQKGEA